VAPVTPGLDGPVAFVARWFGSPARSARVVRSGHAPGARSAVPLYRWLLADGFERLPPAVQRLHMAAPAVSAHGVATVTRGDTLLGRLLARLVGLPKPGTARELRVTVVATASGGEILSRFYPDRVFATAQVAAGAAGSGLISERVGPFALVFRLEARAHGLTFILREARLFGIRLPLPLRPIVQARETADDGTYHFFVRVDLPLIGRLIQYQGRLDEIADG
jgi:hypothetical protein